MTPTNEELNSLVAEVVMEWTTHELGHMWVTPDGNWRKTSTIRKSARPGGEQLQGFPGWSPATDETDAFMVLEKLRPDFPMISVNRSDDGWWVDLYPAVGPTIETGYEETAMRAICIAALRTRGVRVD